jgi:hypothetical protein
MANEVTVNRCELGNASYIVIKTGYAPPLRNLMEIELAVREDTESNMTCLFACDTTWHLGVLVPNPAGFKSSVYTCPKNKDKTKNDETVQQILLLTEHMMSKMSTHPFYDLAKKSYDDLVKHHNRIYTEQNKTRVDLYTDIFNEVKEWTLEPLEPNKKYTKAGCNRLEKYSDVHDLTYERIHEACFGDTKSPVDTPASMPYNERLKEAQKIITLMGGVNQTDGILCFKCDIDKNSHVYPQDIVNTIKNNDLSYCAVFDLECVSCIKSGNDKIIVVEYDAEHG